jgi:hypothetical protein
MGSSVGAEQISVIDHPRRVAGYAAVLLAACKSVPINSSDTGSRRMIQSEQSLRENCSLGHLKTATMTTPTDYEYFERRTECANVRDICGQRLTHVKRPV